MGEVSAVVLWFKHPDFNEWAKYQKYDLPSSAETMAKQFEELDSRYQRGVNLKILAEGVQPH